jgi:hypothetical protein
MDIACRVPLLVGAMCCLGAIKQGTGSKSPKKSPAAREARLKALAPLAPL